jgi:hypothetical protein
MVFWAVAVVLLGIVLKAIAAEPGSMILLPLAAIAGFCHVTVHREAALGKPAPGPGCDLRYRDARRFADADRLWSVSLRAHDDRRRLVGARLVVREAMHADKGSAGGDARRILLRPGRRHMGDAARPLPSSLVLIGRRMG